METKEETTPHCGGCAWFHGENEDEYGNGACRFLPWKHYDDECAAPEHYISREQARHYLAVLRQANRWRRDPNVPAIHRMPQPTEIGKAIDFVVEYAKEFMKL